MRGHLPAAPGLSDPRSTTSSRPGTPWAVGARALLNDEGEKDAGGNEAEEVQAHLVGDVESQEPRNGADAAAVGARREEASAQLAGLELATQPLTGRLAAEQSLAARHADPALGPRFPSPEIVSAAAGGEACNGFNLGRWTVVAPHRSALIVSAPQQRAARVDPPTFCLALVGPGLHATAVRPHSSRYALGSTFMNQSAPAPREQQPHHRQSSHGRRTYSQTSAEAS